MSIASLGSLMTTGKAGQVGTVVSKTPVGTTPDGKQLVRYTIRYRDAPGAGTHDPQSRPAPSAVPQGDRNKAQGPAGAAAAERPAAAQAPKGGAASGDDQPAGPNALTPEEKQVVEDLKRRDAAVRREEEAHAAVAGKYGSPPIYTYQRGPDGQSYRVGGAVAVSASVPQDDPEEARRVGRRIAAAANAPVRPSSADRSAAASGYLLALQAAEQSNRPEGAPRLDEHA